MVGDLVQERRGRLVIRSPRSHKKHDSINKHIIDIRPLAFHQIDQEERDAVAHRFSETKHPTAIISEQGKQKGTYVHREQVGRGPCPLPHLGRTNEEPPWLKSRVCERDWMYWMNSFSNGQ